MELCHMMPFPPLPDEKEHKLTSLKFTATNGTETMISHWTLRRAGPSKDMIAHAMGFSKAIAQVTLSAELKAAQYRRVLSGTAVTAFDKALEDDKDTLRPLVAGSTTERDRAQPPDMSLFVLETCLKYFVEQRTTDSSCYNQI